MLSLKTQDQPFLGFEHAILKVFIKNTAKQFVSGVWLVFGSILKYVHIEHPLN